MGKVGRYRLGFDVCGARGEGIMRKDLIVVIIVV
jgi:hypothetical protein